MTHYFLPRVVHIEYRYSGDTIADTFRLSLDKSSVSISLAKLTHFDTNTSLYFVALQRRVNVTKINFETIKHL